VFGAIALAVGLVAPLWLAAGAADGPDPGQASGPAPRELRIGILAARGEAPTLGHWAPTVDYLGRSLPGLRFTIVPLAYDQVMSAARLRRVDLLLVNPPMFVQAEIELGAVPIATLKNRVAGRDYTRFGGVVLTRAARTDIATLTDLRGRHLGAVAPNSFGGYLMLARELVGQGL
jgi:two-component system sensor histidine kinase TtrS